MEDLRQRHGNHTWDIVLDYHLCPQCGYIIENRQKYTLSSGSYQRNLVCERCKHNFTVTKHKPKTFGPFLGSNPIFEDKPNTRT